MDFWDFFLGSIAIALFIGVVLLWFGTLIDLFMRPDLRGWQKALWLLGIIVFPLLGALIYIIARPMEGPLGLGAASAPEAPLLEDESSLDNEVQELATLARMRDEGVVTPEEFGAIKERILHGGPAAQAA
jgi:hypothetical protein